MNVNHNFNHPYYVDPLEEEWTHEAFVSSKEII